MISIVLPIYNGEKYLEECLESLVAQSYKEFEVIAIDDGSTDDSMSVLKKFGANDSRIRVHTQKNMGLAQTLNKGVSLSKFDIIARIDQDDIATPNRLARQLKEFQSSDDLALLGSQAEIIQDSGEKTNRFFNNPRGGPELYFYSIFDNRFVHSTAMFRKSIFLKIGGYRTQEEFQPEDFDLWSRFVQNYYCKNLDDNLLFYRESSGGMSRSNLALMEKRVQTVTARNLRNILPIMSRHRSLSLAALMRGHPTAKNSIALYFWTMALVLRLALNKKIPLREGIKYTSAIRGTLKGQSILLQYFHRIATKALNFCRRVRNYFL